MFVSQPGVELQSAKPILQANPQVLFTHVAVAFPGAGGHSTPQAPQFDGSCKVVQTVELHILYMQVQFPRTHSNPGEHGCCVGPQQFSLTS